MILGKGDPDIHVAIRQSPGFLVLDVFVFRHTEPGKLQFLSVEKVPKDRNEGFQYRWSEPVSQWEPVNYAPVMQIPLDWAPQLFKAFTEEGFELPSESFLKGQVDATKQHLEDMRRLVFKDSAGSVKA